MRLHAIVPVLALSLASTAVAQQTTPVDAARAAASLNQNSAAAALFLQAIENEPSRRAELLREYADQLTFSGGADRAIALYEEVLRQQQTADERIAALKGLGLALLWADKPGRARPVFAEVMRARADDADASRNFARSLSWGGRQREAIEHLRQHLRRFPADSEAQVLLAQSQAWMGRPDEARYSLAGVEREDAQKLRDRLAFETSPRTVVSTDRSSQSDNLLIRAWRLSQTQPLVNGRAAIGVQLDRHDYDQQDGTDGARVSRLMALARLRASDALEVNVQVGRERTSAMGGTPSEFTSYSTWLTFWPNDVLRFDASTSRSGLDNLRSLQLGLTHRDTGLSADFTPSERQRYTVRWQQSDYSDGNARRSNELEAEYRWSARPEAWVGFKRVAFDFDRQLANGYFNPLHFESTQLTLRARWQPTGSDGRWEVQARGAFGRERATSEGNKNAYDLELTSRFRLGTGTALLAQARRFSSRTASSTGFARSTLGVAIERSW